MWTSGGFPQRVIDKRGKPRRCFRKPQETASSFGVWHGAHRGWAEHRSRRAASSTVGTAEIEDSTARLLSAEPVTCGLKLRRPSPQPLMFEPNCRASPVVGPSSVVVLLQPTRTADPEPTATDLGNYSLSSQLRPTWRL